MSKRRLPALLGAALAVASLIAALGTLSRAFLLQRHSLRAGLDIAHVELGEALRLAWHPGSVNAAYRLPWATVLEADAFLRLSEGELQLAAALLWLLALGLVFALGRELGGTGAGAAAAALWAPVFAALPRGPGFNKQFWLTLLGLLAALLWVRRQRKNTDASSALAGAGLGLTLLTRGAFAFFPPLLALLERKRRGFLLAGVALAFLLPWTLMNAASQRRLIPLEDGSMNMNVVTGALGTVFCAHGDFSALMGEGAGGQGLGSPLLWAARTVLEQPLRYLAGVRGRLERVLSLQPFLFLLAGIALLAHRRDAGARALGGLVFYFILIHCAMSIEDNYFEPLWPLLACLAALPVSLLPEPAPKLGAALARLVLVASLGLSALMSARLFALMGRYAWVAARHGASSDEALDRALGREGDAPWLALADATRRLSLGDAPGAVTVLEHAPALEGLPRRELLLAWARARAGRIEPLLALRLPPREKPAPYGDAQAEALALYQALALEERGRREEALAKLREAGREWAAWQGFLNPGREAAADALAPRLAAAAPARFLTRVDQILEGQGEAVLERAYELSGRALGGAAPWRALFEKRLARGDLKGAQDALRELEKHGEGREQAREAAFAWERLGSPGKAAEAFARVLKTHGEDARTWSDRGVALYRAGRKKEAEKALRRALALDPALDAAQRSLEVVVATTTR